MAALLTGPTSVCWYIHGANNVFETARWTGIERVIYASFHRALAGFTALALDGYGLRDLVLTRPARLKGVVSFKAGSTGGPDTG